MNLAKSTLKNFPKKLEIEVIFMQCNQLLRIENQWSGFFFKITLTGNEFSITNQAVHGFSNIFQHIKN